MPLALDTAVDQIDLTAFVRELPTRRNYTLNAWLPDVTQGSIEYKIRNITKNRRAAVYRGYDTPANIRGREGFSEKQGMLPPISEQKPLTEFERLLQERARFGDAADRQVVEVIYDDARDLTEAVKSRVELARGQVLATGEFSVSDENGLTLVANYGVDGSQFVAPGNLWSDAVNATPVDDMLAWDDQWIEINGDPPGRRLISTRVLRNLMVSQSFRQLANRQGNSTGIVTPGDVARVLNMFGLPPFVIYDTTVKDAAGVDTKPVADDLVITLPSTPRDLGRTIWGPTAEALELASQAGVEFTIEEAPGLYSTVVKEDNPFRMFTTVGATVLPVIDDPNKIIVADVL